MFDMVPFKKNKNSLMHGDYFDELVNNFFNSDFFYPMSKLRNNFKVDLEETENEYIIHADLPGIKKQDIDLDYYNNYLIITAKRNNIIENKNDNYVRQERNYGEFKRSFYIDNVDQNNIHAAFNNGVLKVTLGKENKTINKRNKIQID